MMAPPWMRVSERWSQRSLRSLRMVCADTSKRLARSSTITRPKARAMLRISVWRWDSPATAAPLRNRLGAQSCRYGAADWGRGQRGRSAARAIGQPKQLFWLRRLRRKPCAPHQPRRSTKQFVAARLPPQTKMEETMNIDRRQLALPALALGLLTVVPAFAGADEDAVAKNVEAFRVAQAAGNAEGLASLCAEEMSYSHSNAKVDTKASLLDGVAKANYKWTSLEYKDPTVRVVGPTAIVRFTFVGEQEFTDGKKTPQNLHILMNWQKQGSDWKLLSRAATKL